MKKATLLLCLILKNTFAQNDSLSNQKIPFEGMDQTWQNGNDRIGNYGFTSVVLSGQKSPSTYITVPSEPDRPVTTPGPFVLYS